MTEFGEFSVVAWLVTVDPACQSIISTVQVDRTSIQTNGLEIVLISTIAPDGQHLASTLGVDGRPMIAVTNTRSNQVAFFDIEMLAPGDLPLREEVVGRGGAGVRELYFSPDGKTLAYVLVHLRRAAYLCVLDIPNKRARLVGEIGRERLLQWGLLAYPWSPDSKALLVPTTGNGYEIYRLSDGRRRKLNATGRMMQWLKGETSQVSYLSTEGDYRHLDLDSNQDQILCSLKNPEDIQFIGMTPDRQCAFVIRKHTKMTHDAVFELINLGDCTIRTVIERGGFFPLISFAVVDDAPGVAPSLGAPKSDP